MQVKIKYSILEVKVFSYMNCGAKIEHHMASEKYSILKVKVGYMNCGAKFVVFGENVMYEVKWTNII